MVFPAYVKLWQREPVFFFNSLKQQIEKRLRSTITGKSAAENNWNKQTMVIKKHESD